MKRFDPRIVIGTLLILAGGLGFLQAFGFLRDASDVFWGLVFLAAGGVFLFLFAGGFASGQWWAAFPGFVLAGIGVLILLPDALDDIGGAVFLGAIGLSFWMVYLTGRDRWWAIIPGGVLFTLAVVSALPEKLFGGADSGGVFFLGLALTFLLVALLAKMSWAYWPAGALGVFGTFLFFQSQIYLLSYVAAAALIVVGIFIILRSLRSR
ncbi:MAG: hypothetical protein JW963_12795 [Anaerolineales bacterium]|nr:hypothetical protein [Anaerolineales bacterium]